MDEQVTVRELVIAVWDSNMPYKVKKLVLTRMGVKVTFSPEDVDAGKPAQMHGSFYEMFNERVL